MPPPGNDLIRRPRTRIAPAGPSAPPGAALGDRLTGLLAAAAAPAGPVLHPGEGPIAGTYVPATPGTVRWGVLPGRDAAPVATVVSGGLVTMDTVSHEGILEEQGRDPVAWFGRYGVPASDVLLDAVELAGSRLTRRTGAGPHVVVGPVSVAGARPGDVLKIELCSLTPRVPYGVISDRDGTRAPAVSAFSPLRSCRGGPAGELAVGPRRVRYPLAPFLGVAGVTCNSARELSSVTPTRAGGNLGVGELVAGTTLYLPVLVPGAGLFAGDPHYGRHGAASMEAPLRVTMRVSVLPRGSGGIPGGRGRIDRPLGETPTHWLPVGLPAPGGDLGEAMRDAVGQAVGLLVAQDGMGRAEAHAYLTETAELAAVVAADGTAGIHARVPKRRAARPR
jgi:acetamidase/formamidase